ncbi:hypothetical protein Ccrd_023013 [Cynara cardunculus var. scolymus]|uniref:Uncharacterized protein n=1 Tax=Cynara cardunculus var. scolymus TaxID=59895 RepID=A0A103XXS6_CYNCS|nr:hypothetical protein Ccrd_023013 [Cynara cardunculus var. scolymus]
MANKGEAVMKHALLHNLTTYEYEKKLYNNHLESLQVMEKNYMTMASEVEKLRAELKKHAEIDRTAGPYVGFVGYSDKEASGHYPVGQNTYDDAYGVPRRNRMWANVF